MWRGTFFIGVGDDGKRIAMELSRLYDGIKAELFDPEHDDPQHHLHILAYPSTADDFVEPAEQFIILTGSIHEPAWQEARKALHEGRPCLLWTIGIGHNQKIAPDILGPFPNECLLLPDPAIADAANLSQMALQIFFIHTPWFVCPQRGSLIGYDLSDTKGIFAGKAVKAATMTSDRDNYRDNFSRFLCEKEADLIRAQGILMSLWGRDEVLSIPKASDLWDEMKRITMSDASQMLTFHILPNDGPDFMVTLFFTC